MTDDFMKVLEYHDHPAGEWCDDELCSQRVLATAAIQATEPDAEEVLAFGTRTDNAQLMADCAALGYLPEPVLDATYGQGRFWRQFRPERLYTNDHDPATDAEHHLDFRDLCIFNDRGVATVVFDPPYKLNGTATHPLDATYGAGGPYDPVAAKLELMERGAGECARVADRFLIVKCQDQVVSGAVVWQTRIMADYVEDCGFRLKDMLHVRGYRKQPPGRRQVHARRDYSTALIFERKR